MREEFAILRGSNIAVLKGRELARQTESEFLVIGDQPASHANEVTEELPVIANSRQEKKSSIQVHNQFG